MQHAVSVLQQMETQGGPWDVLWLFTFLFLRFPLARCGRSFVMSPSFLAELPSLRVAVVQEQETKEQ